MADPYTTLGVQKGATEAEIKKAYRKLAKELHPDKNQGNPKASERFSQVTAAYDLLSDKDKRARFDRGEIDDQGNPANPFASGGSPFGGGGFRPQQGGGGFGGGGGADLGDIFEGLFGGGNARSAGGGFGGFGGRGAQPKGANVNYKLAVPFEDAAKLQPQRITLQDGKTIDLKLPTGVETGTQMRLSGKGQQGPGGNGDAIVTIEIGNHRFYTRDGDAVRLDLPVTLTEAVLGGPVKVPTVDGAVMLNIPKGATSGKVLRLKERGFTSKTGKRGDQLVTLVIDVPSDDADLHKFATEWQDTRNPRASMGV
jgi:DnaJ-class molecular chaperone